MADMKRIYDFATKWRDKFSDKNINYKELVGHWLPDDCESLGFEMDLRSAFSEKYEQATIDFKALSKIIGDIRDISLLGTLIYNRWKEFNNRTDGGRAILKPQNRMWFILVFNRLALLSNEKPITQGTLKKARIYSNNVCYGSMPEPNDVVAQELIIDDEGNVSFSSYIFLNEKKQCERSGIRNFKIEKVSATYLLNALTTFTNQYCGVYTTDVGIWDMELTDTAGNVYNFQGALCIEFKYEGVDLSDLVRDIVGIDDLFVFDGNYEPDVMNKIILDYYRLNIIKMNEEVRKILKRNIVWEYTEHLIIDRATEILEHIQNVGTNCKVSRKYEIKDGIESLFEELDDMNLFSFIEGNPDDGMDNPDETKKYKITIDYKNKPQRIIEGSYDKKDLPNDFANFVETVFDFISVYGLGEIFASSNYNKLKRRQSDYIFCSVTFGKSEKSYYYLTDDDSIKVGDFVLVESGHDNHEAVVEVVNIEYFGEENVPLPIEKIKRVIRKCKDDDFDVL